MTLKQRLETISKLQEHKLPWNAMRAFGKLELLGDQVCFRSKDDTDYMSIDELRTAIEELTAELGGKVSWKKEKKNETTSS